MKVLGIQGSPRKNRNTALLLEKYLKGIESNGKMEVESIYLQGNNIKPCTSCYACRGEHKGKCVINDDMQKIYPKFIESQFIVFATPIYWWNMTAQLKIFIDRLFAIGGAVGESKFKGKKVILLMTYGGELPNSGPEIVEKSLRDICDYLDMELVKVYGVCTDENVPVAENEKVLSEIYELGKNL